MIVKLSELIVGDQVVAFSTHDDSSRPPKWLDINDGWPNRWTVAQVRGRCSPTKISVFAVDESLMLTHTYDAEVKVAPRRPTEEISGTEVCVGDTVHAWSEGYGWNLFGTSPRVVVSIEDRHLVGASRYRFLYQSTQLRLKVWRAQQYANPKSAARMREYLEKLVR